MLTEREVLLQIIRDDPNGIPELFFRHAALFREALIRFYGNAGLKEAEPLASVLGIVKQDLKEGRFDDLRETFYNWIVRRTWSELLTLCMEEEGGEHVKPDIIFQCADPCNESDITKDDCTACRAHVESCAFCRNLSDKCKDIPLNVRHAGAPCPEEFESVKNRVIEVMATLS